MKIELFRIIFFNNLMSLLGRFVVMKVFIVIEISSGFWVSDRVVCIICKYKIKLWLRFIIIVDN